MNWIIFHSSVVHNYAIDSLSEAQSQLTYVVRMCTTSGYCFVLSAVYVGCKYSRTHTGGRQGSTVADIEPIKHELTCVLMRDKSCSQIAIERQQLLLRLPCNASWHSLDAAVFCGTVSMVCLVTTMKQLNVVGLLETL